MREDTRVRLMVIVLDRGKGVRAAELFAGCGLPFHYGTPGRGTANSELLDYLGLGDTEKDVVFTLTPGHTIPALLGMAAEKLQLAVPGKGILFTVPLSAIGGAAARHICGQAHRAGKEQEEAMPEQWKNDLIVAVVNGGCTDAVMEAAKAAGARGGTVLHGRRMGEADEKSGESGVWPEKDIVTILVPRELRQPIMEAVNHAAGADTESRGVLFSLPVEHAMGLSWRES